VACCWADGILADVQDNFETVEEESIRDNFVTVYELLDEVSSSS
jgi:hypothetical protein